MSGLRCQGDQRSEQYDHTFTQSLAKSYAESYTEPITDSRASRDCGDEEGSFCFL